MINQWAKRWGVPQAALDDLNRMMTAEHAAPVELPTARNLVPSEAYAQAMTRLSESRQGATLWRNNVGVLTDERGVPVRYGLANESKQMNARLKSSDLIGWRSIRIEQHHVGAIFAQFTAREIKTPGWQYTGSGREKAQLAWIELVVAAGGDAKFATGG